MTLWFPKNIKPVRVGVYQTSFDGSVGYSFWNATHWGDQFITPAQADSIRGYGVQGKRWRGLTDQAILAQVFGSCLRGHVPALVEEAAL